MLHRPVQYFLQSMLEEVTWENIAFPLQDKTDRYCTQPHVGDHYPSYKGIQQFEMEELDDMLALGRRICWSRSS